MERNNVIKIAGRNTISDPLTDLLKAGAEKLIFQAVEAELHELLALHSECLTREFSVSAGTGIHSQSAVTGLTNMLFRKITSHLTGQ
jgi:hypothetical protein